MAGVVLYAQLGSAPQIISALNFKTRTPGSVFKIAYSLDNLDDEDGYPDLNWIDIPKYYKLRNGRIDVDTILARHIRLTFTSLQPMLLKEFYSET